MTEKHKIFQGSKTIDGNIADGFTIVVKGDLIVNGRVGDDVTLAAEGSITLQDTGKNLRAEANAAFKARHVGEDALISAQETAAVESLGHRSRLFGKKGVSSEGPCGDHNVYIHSGGVELMRKPPAEERTGSACPLPQQGKPAP